MKLFKHSVHFSIIASLYLSSCTEGTKQNIPNSEDELVKSMVDLAANTPIMPDSFKTVQDLYLFRKGKRIIDLNSCKKNVIYKLTATFFNYEFGEINKNGSIKYFWILDESGNILYDSTGTWGGHSEMDYIDNNMSELRIYSTTGAIDRYTYKYQGDLMVEEKLYNQDNELSKKWEGEYDENRTLINSRSYFGDGRKDERNIRDYDLIELNNLSVAGNEKYNFTFRMDSKGRLVNENWYDLQRNVLHQRIEYTYNPQTGLPSSEITYDEEGDPKSFIKYTYIAFDMK